LKTHKYFRGSIYIPIADVKAEGKKADTKLLQKTRRKLRRLRRVQRNAEEKEVE
jgi:hypothetical protein